MCDFEYLTGSVIKRDQVDYVFSFQPYTRLSTLSFRLETYSLIVVTFWCVWRNPEWTFPIDRNIVTAIHPSRGVPRPNTILVLMCRPRYHRTKVLPDWWLFKPWGWAPLPKTQERSSLWWIMRKSELLKHFYQDGRKEKVFSYFLCFNAIINCRIADVDINKFARPTFSTFSPQAITGQA